MDAINDITLLLFFAATQLTAVGMILLGYTGMRKFR
mgnify:CR=1 FL=1